MASLGEDEINLNSVIFIEDGKVYRKAQAAMRIARYLKGWPSIIQYFTWVPKVVSNGLYDFIGQRRYKWFGKKSVCFVPTPELEARFMTVEKIESINL